MTSAWQRACPQSCDPDKPDNRELPVRGFGVHLVQQRGHPHGAGLGRQEQGFEGGVLLHPFENGYILRDSDGYGSRAYMLSGATFTFFRTDY